MAKVGLNDDSARVPGNAHPAAAPRTERGRRRSASQRTS